MKNYFFVFILIFTLAKKLWAQDFLAKAYFSEQRDFYISAPVRGEWLSRDPFRIFIYDEAKKSCPIKAHQIQNRISEFNEDGVRFWKKMNTILTNIQMLVNKKNIFIAIDDFSEKRKIFSSYHLKDSPIAGQNLIVLDCQSFQNEDWKSLLGHELIHAALADKNAPIWIEELLAQTVEYLLTEKWPDEKINLLRAQSFLPSPVSQNRPFLDNSTYAMNFLFGQYLIKKLGGPVVLRALNPLIDESRCHKNLDLEQFICRLKVMSGGMLGDLSWLNQDSLLQNFTVAMQINRDEVSTKGFYSVPGWNGFLPNKPVDIKLIPKNSIEKGSFIRGPIEQVNELFQQFGERAFIFRVIQDYSYYKITDNLTDSSFLNSKKESLSDQVIVLF